MASVVPARYLYSPSSDAARIAVAAIIDKGDEVGDEVERVNFLYATAGRRALLDRVYIPSIYTTSATAIALTDYYARMSMTRDEATVITHASDAVITVGFYTTGGVLIGSIVTLTHAAGASTNQTATYTGITSTEVLIRVTVKRIATATSFEAIRVLEVALLAADLP
jgi:hypothetical protein